MIRTESGRFWWADLKGRFGGQILKGRDKKLCWFIVASHSTKTCSKWNHHFRTLVPCCSFPSIFGKCTHDSTYGGLGVCPYYNKVSIWSLLLSKAFNLLNV